VSNDHFLVLPILRPDVIETHADPDGLVRVMGPDGEKLIAPEGDTTGSPVMLIVPPPSKTSEVPLTTTVRSAWA
jgi:hypothetical protein